jgi:hypothetical protein
LDFEILISTISAITFGKQSTCQSNGDRFALGGWLRECRREGGDQGEEAGDGSSHLTPNLLPDITGNLSRKPPELPGGLDPRANFDAEVICKIAPVDREFEKPTRTSDRERFPRSDLGVAVAEGRTLPTAAGFDRAIREGFGWELGDREIRDRVSESIDIDDLPL